MLIDTMINCGRFSEYVRELLQINSNEDCWEYYLHHPFIERSFSDFKKALKIDNSSTDSQPDVDIKATINTSMDILNNFVPE